ncbi:MAG: DUF5116 domain-containing protein [Bacteroidales bacterium]|nr:DUF5116 domain-containing protein [Bacteroidales bacterium]
MKKINLTIAALTICSMIGYAADKPAPLYWSAYEYCYEAANGSATDNTYIPEDEWKKNIDWMADNLKDYGYTMVCIDGWGTTNDGGSWSGNGYRKKHDDHWQHDYAYWADYLKSKGMTLGIYQNPLWINMAKGDNYIKGTNIKIKDIVSGLPATWFSWVDPTKNGAEEYVKGYVKYYADMGVSYLRVDFLSWYEDGIDRQPDFTARSNRPIEHYQTALRWMKEACDEYGVTLSLVMPHLYNHAINERTYAPGSLIRINDDVCDGKWWRFSDMERGVKHDIWPTYYNAFDGFIHWSDLSGKNKNNMILDGDFTRLNTFSDDNERKSCISLQIIAGGPVAVADRYNTIGNNLWLYQNRELLALHNQNFIGHPLSTDVGSAKSQIWIGKTDECDYILALFNRADGAKTVNVDFKEVFGFDSPVEVRDLWEHRDLGKMSSVSVSIPRRGCMIYRLKSN